MEGRYADGIENFHVKRDLPRPEQKEGLKQVMAEWAKRVEVRNGFWKREAKTSSGEEVRVGVATFPQMQTLGGDDYRVEVKYPWQDTGTGSSPYQVTEVWSLAKDGEWQYSPSVVYANSQDVEVARDYQFPTAESMIRVYTAQQQAFGGERVSREATALEVGEVTRMVESVGKNDESAL